MSGHPHYSWRDSLGETFYRVACKYPRLRVFHRQSAANWNQPDAPVACCHLEVVSHCWQYAHLLRYQLHSLLEHAPRATRVTMTVFYSEIDLATAQLLRLYRNRSIPGVTWRFESLSPPQLFRRAIGRNQAALTTDADWIWFTDCDVLFGEGCFDRLAQSLSQTSAPLVFPTREYRSSVLSDGHRLLSKNNFLQPPPILPNRDFFAYTLDRATGPYQIVRGDVARALGYCATPRIFQKPAHHWRKATEDRVFRWLLGSEGVAVDAGTVYRIQHREKGRYRKGGWLRNCLVHLRTALQARHIRRLGKTQRH